MVAEAVGRTINVGSGREIPVPELAELITTAAGRPDLVPEYHPDRPGDVRRLFSDSARAADLLGWKPEVSLREGLQRLLAWHDEQGTDWAAALREDVTFNWKPES